MPSCYSANTAVIDDGTDLAVRKTGTHGTE